MASDSSPGHINGGPSSPNDFASSPNENTNSSPGDGGRLTRRRQRPSSSNYSTPQSQRSNLNPSNEARTPSSTGSRRRAHPRRDSHPSTPVAPTPTSSEAGGGFDGDDAPPMYVWGANISVQDVNELILRNFRDDSEGLESGEFEGKYMRLIRRVIISWVCSG